MSAGKWSDLTVGGAVLLTADERSELARMGGAPDESRGIDRLRDAVAFFDHCDESFLERFCAEDLLRIFAYLQRHDEISASPNEWSKDLLLTALVDVESWRGWRSSGDVSLVVSGSDCLNPCEICGESAGEDYCSDDRCNRLIKGLVLCEPCVTKVSGIESDAEYLAAFKRAT